MITATGFDLSVLGDIPFAVDGNPVDWADTVTYRGMMFSGVPNMAWVFGYFRASWTLRVDLMADFRLPAAEAHAGQGRARSDGRAAGGHAGARELDRPGELQPGLPGRAPCT